MGGVLYTIGCIVGVEQFEIKDLVKCSLPFFFDKCWFINVYLVLYALIPFINKMISGLTKESYQSLLLISGVLFSIWPAFLPNAPSTDNGYGIISFVLLYIIGAFLRLYTENRQSSAMLLGMYLIFSLISLLLFYHSGWTWHWINYNSPFIILASVAMLILFQKMSFHSKAINYISQSVIAVFLIHTNQTIRPNIFVKWFALQNHLHSSLLAFMPYHIMMVGIIFAVCVALDLLRRFIFSLTYDRMIDGIPMLNRVIEV